VGLEGRVFIAWELLLLLQMVVVVLVMVVVYFCEGVCV
jgi:hypothetical protein